ncbi:hypothetical protein BDQ17DRAFT_1412722 [Cyathus striatus]|nr:hypothetical protein BDQ17DRAFT_1412722 [Cyathus striatus]
MSQISIAISKTKIKYSFSGFYGTQLIATMLNATAYGVVLTMALQYFVYHSKGDTLFVKGMVILLATLATLETVCASYQMFEYFIFKFGREDLFDVIERSLMGKYIGIYLTAFVTQIFYATRIWTLQISLMGNAKTFSNLKKLSYIVQTVIVAQGASAAACDVAIFIHVAHAKFSVCALLTAFMFPYLRGTYSYMIPLLLNTHHSLQEEVYEKMITHSG